MVYSPTARQFGAKWGDECVMRCFTPKSELRQIAIDPNISEATTRKLKQNPVNTLVKSFADLSLNEVNITSKSEIELQPIKTTTAPKTIADMLPACFDGCTKDGHTKIRQLVLAYMAPKYAEDYFRDVQASSELSRVLLIRGKVQEASNIAYCSSPSTMLISLSNSIDQYKTSIECYLPDAIAQNEDHDDDFLSVMQKITAGPKFSLPWAWTEKYVLPFFQGEQSLAEKRIKKITEKFPESGYFHLVLGTFYWLKKTQTDKEKKLIAFHFDKYASLCETSTEVHFLFGDILLDLRQLEASEKYLKKVLQSSPHDINTLVALGDGYAKQKKYQDSKKYYELALAEDAKCSDALLGLGYVCAQLEEDKLNSRAYYKRANPNAFKWIEFRKNDSDP